VERCFVNDNCSVVLYSLLQVPADLTSVKQAGHPMNICSNYVINIFIIVIYSGE